MIRYITCVYIQKQPSVVAIKAVEILKIIKYMKMYALLPRGRDKLHWCVASSQFTTLYRNVLTYSASNEKQ